MELAAKTVSVKLSPGMRERIQRLADANKRTPHWLMREAIEAFVDEEEKREKLRQDLMRAWREYEETGLHLTGQEADAWLSKLEAGIDAEIPECHR